jgi:uncharacterized delta-60 repeat protein
MLKMASWSVLLTVIILAASVAAQPEVDSSFGKLIFTNGHGGYAQDLVVQPDDKVVMVSNCPHFEDGNYPFCAVRVNVNGSYDTSFVGSGNRIPGVVRTRIPGASTVGQTHGVALQSDGKLILVGYAFVSGFDQRLSMVRYHPNGDIDTTFGTNGFVLTDVTAGLKDLGRKVAIQSDGKIVVVGYSTDDTNYVQFVARYTAAGVLDDTFATGGVFKASLPGNISDGRSIALQADGKILAGGNINGLQTAFLLTRLNANGSLDTSWDGDGYKIIPHTAPGMHPLSEHGFRALAVQADNKILGLGNWNVIFRFNTDGSLDSSFDKDGMRAALPESLHNEAAYDLMSTAGGRITVVGQSQPGANAYVFEVARYLTNGSPDTAFSGDGSLSVPIISNSGARAVSTDSMGRIVLAGISGTGSCGQCWPFENSFFSATRLTAPFVSVSISGRVTRPDGRPIMNAILTTQDSTGTTRNAITNPFGYYRFPNLPAGQAYTISARAKSYVFADRVAVASDDVLNFDFVGQPE